MADFENNVNPIDPEVIVDADCTVDEDTVDAEVVEETGDAKEDDGTEEIEIQFPRIARFEKVTFEEFCAVYKPIWVENNKLIARENGINVDDEGFSYKEEDFVKTAQGIYDNIQVPERFGAGAAGYDFIFPYGQTELSPGTSFVIPTGIKCQLAPGWMLVIVPRESLGFNYRIQLDNTLGIISGDYYGNPSNGGHIFVKMTNDSRDKSTYVFETGTKYCQGIFVPFGITFDDEKTKVRVERTDEQE